MTIQHHPADELLVELAAGRLPGGQSVLLSTHLENCATCRARVHLLQAVGGTLLEQTAPEPLAPDAWARTLARIDAPASPAGPSRVRGRRANISRPALPGGMAWPAALRDSRVSRWWWMGPGMRFARVSVPHDPTASLFLLRVGEGRQLPQHGHSGLEMTQVLHGAFDDGRETFAEGDFDAADEEVRHQPVVTGTHECICLAYIGHALRFEGRVASLVGRIIGM